jgi:hypothetical protein
LPSLAWVWLDKSLWWWDQSWYGEVALNIFLGFEHGIRSGLYEMMIAFQIKAPLIAWLEALAVPFGATLHRINAVFLTEMLLIQAGALVLFYGVLKRATKNTFSAGLGVVALAAAPLFIALSHQNFVEPMQVFVVVWFLYIAQRAPQWNRIHIALHVVSATMLGMMVKISTPIFVVIPGLIGVYWFFATQQRVSFKKYFQSSLHVLAASATLGISLLSVAWYFKNFKQIAQFALSTSSGNIALLYGTSASFLDKIFFWITQIGVVFFTPYTLIITPLIVLGVVKVLMTRSWKKWKWDTLVNPHLALVSIFSLLIVIVVFSFQINSLARFLLPAFPYIAAFIAISSVYIPRSAQVIVLCGFLLQSLVLHAFTLHALSYTYDVSRVDFLQAYETNNAVAKRMSEVVAATCNSLTAGKISIFGLDASVFNSNAASFVSAKSAAASGSPSCKYSMLGLAEQDKDKALNRIFEFKAPYYITLDPVKFPELYGGTFNAVSLEVLREIERDRRFVKEVFMNSDVLLYALPANQK